MTDDHVCDCYFIMFSMNNWWWIYNAMNRQLALNYLLENSSKMFKISVIGYILLVKNEHCDLSISPV